MHRLSCLAVSFDLRHVSSSRSGVPATGAKETPAPIEQILKLTLKIQIFFGRTTAPFQNPWDTQAYHWPFNPPIAVTR
jgi:hypothetical protein